MSALADGHVLTTDTNSAGTPDTFKHWDQDGVFIETVDISGLKSLYNPGYSVSRIWALALAQYGSSIYALLGDTNKYYVIVEFDSNLDYVRYVCHPLDQSVAAQNPNGTLLVFWSGPVDLDLDHDGNIYVSPGGPDPSRDWVYKYNNAGTFVAILDESYSIEGAWAVKKPTNGYLHNIINKSVITGTANDHATIGINRWNGTSDLGFTLVKTNPDGTTFPQFQEAVANNRRGVFDDNENFYFSSFDFNSGVTPSRVRDYVHKIEPDQTVTSLTLTNTPTNAAATANLVRVTRDGTKAWLVATDNTGTIPIPIYMYQIDLSDGSILIDTVQIALSDSPDLLVYRGLWPGLQRKAFGVAYQWFKTVFP